jgi:RNA recognition motif-containing protein
MPTQTSGRSRRSRGGRSRRSGGNRPNRPEYTPKGPAKKQTVWQKIAGFFSGDAKPAPKRAEQPRMNGSHPPKSSEPKPERTSRKPEQVEVTSPRLYVGNLSFDATESDLFELFNGVGKVQNAEVVTYKHNQRSKGFAFVQMLTVEEAQRAVAELHDKEFLGRKLLVSGAKSNERHTED